ncbi:carbamoyltransferase HypF [Patescibacteria group bacterium]
MPTVFLCADCLKELRNPKNRRCNYPFISCTNCGPRFSVVKSTPYDRERTSMKQFKMCSKCREEYTNPDSRFYHAETTACPQCGPQLSLYRRGRKTATADPISEIAKLIRQGEIVAIKGIGGFHLVCNAKKQTVSELRKLTGRLTKPYALMAENISAAKKLAKINQSEAEWLQNPARPIVVLQKKQAKSLLSISCLDSLGLMLPYTGLHYLLFDHFSEPLVFTSANLPDNPLSIKREEQFVDAVLDHNREIINPIDDSVVKIINGHPLFLRRARGYVPEPIQTVTGRKAGTLSLGAEQNSTFSLITANDAVTSQHLGNTHRPQSLERFRKTVGKYRRFYNIKPRQIVTDLHPQYSSSLYGQDLARSLKISPTTAQHHIAHVMSVATEHNLNDFVGIAADGAGYGTDDTIWGGEVFKSQKVKGKRQITRIGSLELQPMIGGDKATQDPPRMLMGILAKFCDDQALWQFMKRFYRRSDFDVLQKQLVENFNIRQTSSTGRILDAAAALLGFCDKRTYEGEPAITLEANSTNPYSDLKPDLVRQGHLWRLQTTSVFEYLLANKNRDPKRLAATVQHYLAMGLWQIAKKAPNKQPVVFSGGVVYNRIITTYLTNKGCLVNKRIPPGDGGISFGQLQF